MLKRLEYYFHIISLTVFSKAVLPLLLSSNGYNYSYDPVAGNKALQVTNSVLVVVIVYLALIKSSNIKLIRLAWKKNPWLILLLFHAALSILWSYEKAVSVRVVVSILATTYYALYLRVSYSDRELLNIITGFLGWLTLLNVFAIVVAPEIAFFPLAKGEAFRGVFLHKNRLGVFSALSLLAFYIKIKTTGTRKRHYYLLAALSLALLVGSKSMTSMLTFFALISALSLWERLGKGTSKFFTVMLCLGVVLVVLTLISISGETSEFDKNFSSILEGLGRDITLSGRTTIWAYVLYYISQNPWLGYGMGGFWLGWEGLSWKLAKIRHTIAIHAHNGYLDTLLNIGAIGLALFLLSALSALMRLNRLGNKTHRDTYKFWFSMIVLTLIYNLSESSILERSSSLWVLYVLAIIF